MKPPDEVRRTLVEKWLAKADQDFGVAKQLYSDGARYAEAIGFHCQQAIEKYLKAYLTLHGIEAPKTHNLIELRLLAGRADKGLAEELVEITMLNPFGVEYRYPGDAPEMLPEELATVIVIAERARETILWRMRGKLQE